MVNFYTDADLSGAGEFVESTVTLATEFTLPAGTINAVRTHFPAVAGATPLARVYNSGGTQLFAGGFDSSTPDAWNSATISGGLSVSAGTYRVAIVVTRYVAKGSFFSGGSVVRNGITGVQSRFDSGDVAPASTSTATYFADLDFTATGSSATPNGLAVAVALGTPSTSIPSSAPTGLAVPVALGQPAASLNRSAAPTGLAVAVAVGTPAVAVNRSAQPSGLSVTIALGLPRVVDASQPPGSGQRRVQSSPRGRHVQGNILGRRT